MRRMRVRCWEEALEEEELREEILGELRRDLGVRKGASRWTGEDALLEREDSLPVRRAVRGILSMEIG